MKSLVLKYDAERSKGKGNFNNILSTCFTRIYKLFVRLCVFLHLLWVNYHKIKIIFKKKNYLIKFKRRATLSTALVVIGKIIPSGKFTCIQHNCLK